MNVQLFSTLVSLAVASGVNLYATVLVIGLSVRFGFAQDVPPALQVLASWPVLVVAGILYAVEFLADKIQFVDNAWDALHTLIRPLGAAGLGGSALAGADPGVQTAAALLAGSLALTSHSGKAGARIALNVASPAENVSNIGVSIAEDFGVGLLVILALKYPIAAGVIALLLLTLIVIFAPRLIRWALFMVRAIIASIRGIVRKQTESEKLPSTHREHLPPSEPELTASCTGQGIQRGSGRFGYLSLIGRSLFFTYSAWFRDRAWKVPLDQVMAIDLRSRMLMDVLEIQYRPGERELPRTARFVFFKDRTTLARQFVRRLGGAVVS